MPESERHGRVRDQGPFWFLANFQFFAIAIGFVGPSLGLSLGYAALAGAIICGSRVRDPVKWLRVEGEKMKS